MTLWIVFAVLTLAAIGFVVTPLFRQQKKLTPVIIVAIVVVVGISAGLYQRNGTPDAPPGGSEIAAVDDMLVGLAQRLDSNPDDLEGWVLLGRSYMSVGNFEGAIAAFERAIVLDGGEDATTLVSLGESLLAGTGGAIEGRIASLFESALEIDANNPQALFYGGIGAFNQDNPELAAIRWERLLGLNPPAEIEGILRQRIAEWRGEPVAELPPDHPPLEAAPAAEQAPPPIEQPGAIISAAVSIAATANVPANATVFIIARDPAQPSPPIAVKRLNTSELPTTVNLSDGDSMVQGRSLSGFADIEIIARVSASGRPTQQSGDWFGVQVIKPAENKNVALLIDQQVP
ncbi:MAG: tetratricopeptide repeat protein [Gammaproteobacteria bacterium]|nr:tetratricopeptide repeat protein [Gammaproteobacteria bacterium]MDH3414974.1 tetratricopeptide repeat protein [Gammaproteobacteria bacterium]